MDHLTRSLLEQQSTLAAIVMLLLELQIHIREVLGSNLSLDIDYPDQFFVVVVFPESAQENTGIVP
jgi:hypothetical protein